METEGSGASRAGGDGIHNEDAFVVEEGLGLYVVCDGASDRPAGELAAAVAAEALEEFIERAGGELDLRGDRAARLLVRRAMEFAAFAIEEAAARDGRLRGLTTTITLLLGQGDRGVIGHRGDSRAYLIRRGRVQQLTVDHELTDSLPRDARSGDEADRERFAADLDVFVFDLRAGDTIVLCTDGAESVVEDRALVRAAGELSPRLLASRIVSTAHRERGSVDATAVVVRVRGDAEPGWLELSWLPRETAFGHTLRLA